jgi:myo-inositol-1(or 4)-monophosphatase
MDLRLLQSIGKKLFGEIPSMGKVSKTPLGIGAAGDKTYPIDKRAEEIIISVLEESGEPLTIISEETGVRDIHGGGKKVLVDPVDGSRNAISGIPFYCSSIALADGKTIGDIELAYVLNIITGDEFWAERGKGAFLNNKKITAQADAELSLIAYEAQSPVKDIPYILPLLSEAKKTRCLGSTALDLAYLAFGAISIFANPSPSRSFDFAGGWLLVKEAGGFFTNIEGKPIEQLELGLKKTTSLLVSGNEMLHKRALDLLRKK